jgi:predicted metal-dependent hydrolase
MAAARTPSSAPPDDGEHRRIELDHPVLDHVDVRVRRNRRSRHVRLHVDELGAVTASVPQRFAAARIDPIVQERADWLHDVIERMELKTRDTEVDLERGDPVRWLGSWVPTRLVRGGRRASANLADGRLELRVPEGDDPHDALVAWYRKAARTVFEAKVDHWAGELGLRAGKVSIRNQRTRWGSCTYEGDLSFNWRLVLAPEWVLDSIVVHELCHIDELNHSDRFWALLDERYPRHVEASEWLREHGAALRVTRPGTRRLTGAVEGDLRARAGEVAPTGARVRRRGRGRGDESAGEQFSLFGD